MITFANIVMAHESAVARYDRERKEEAAIEAEKRAANIEKLKSRRPTRKTKGDSVIELLNSDPDRRFTTDEVRDHLRKNDYPLPERLNDFLNHLKYDLRINGIPGKNKWAQPLWYARSETVSAPVTSCFQARSGHRQRVALSSAGNR